MAYAGYYVFAFDNSNLYFKNYIKFLKIFDMLIFH